MSDDPHKSRKTPASALDALVREAKQDLAPRMDDETWAALEERLITRMASSSDEGAPPPLTPEERSPLVAEVHALPSAKTRVLRIGALVLAAAAAVALVAKRDPGATIDSNATARAELTAGSLRSTEGPGEVRIGGLLASPGHVLRAGDLVESTAGARAVLERPRKVMWLLERNAPDSAAPSARARVKSAGEALILDLEDGAVEAQVTPVPSGEAFAVDVAAGSHLVRVAVHGTHLRVARTGSRVVIDLTEGVVSIGVPPRTGTTYGTLVTAPSHVEFDAADLDATLRVDHVATSVRAPISLASHDAPIAVRSDPDRVAFPDRTDRTDRTDRDNRASPERARDSVPPVAPATVPRPASVPLPRPPDPARIDPAAKRDPAQPEAAKVPPREAIASAVRACAAARNRPENVRVTVTSSLRLKITASGDVESAQFDPPLLPEIQTCAAAAIYKARIEERGGSVTIPIAFSY